MLGISGKNLLLCLLILAVPLATAYIGVSFAQDETMGRAVKKNLTEWVLDHDCDSIPAEKCPLDRCQVVKNCAGENLCYKRVAIPKECGMAGYIGNQEIRCCPGLVRRCGRIATDGSCDATLTKGDFIGDWTFPACIPCGNGICNTSENRCSCPEDCLPGKTHHNITYESRTLPELLKGPRVLQGGTPKTGDIPQFVEKLLEAYTKRDSTICKNLPKPQKQIFDHGDYADSAPSRAAWVAYCAAVASRDPAACKKIGRSSLNSECELFFKSVAAPGNTSPQFCFDEFGKSLPSTKAVAECLLTWRSATFGHRRSDEIASSRTIKPFEEWQLRVFSCSEKLQHDQHGRPLEDSVYSQSECLFKSAQEFNKPILCRFIDNSWSNKAVTAGFTEKVCAASIGNFQTQDEGTSPFESLFQEFTAGDTADARRQELVQVLRAAPFELIGPQTLRLWRRDDKNSQTDSSSRRPQSISQSDTLRRGLPYYAQELWQGLTKYNREELRSALFKLLSNQDTPQDERGQYIIVLYRFNPADPAMLKNLSTFLKAPGIPKDEQEQYIKALSKLPIDGNLFSLAEDNEMAPYVRYGFSKMLIRKDPNLYLPLYIDTCKALPREQTGNYFIAGIDGLNLNELHEENRKAFLKYGFELLKDVSTADSSTGYSLAHALEIVMPQKCESDMSNAKYRGNGQLNDLFYRETVENCVKWYNSHRDEIVQ